MTGFTEEQRYQYDDLTPDSLVLDVGGYEGDFADGINKRYGCRVAIYEPVPEMFLKIKERFKGNPDVQVKNAGVWGAPHNNTVPMFIKGSMTGLYSDGIKVMVRMDDVAALPWANLLKLNIEGAEFSVLERLLNAGMIDQFKNIQVQWHAVVPAAAHRYEALQIRLALTHRLTMDFGWTWQSWRIKTP